MDDNNIELQEETQLSKTEKAEEASHDVAEVVARGLGRYFGGATGGAVVDTALKTKTGQKVLRNASKKVAHSPGMKGNLARSYGFVNKYKNTAHQVIDNIGTTNYDSGDSDNNSSDRISGTGVVSGLWNKLSLKSKLIIIGVIAGFMFLLIFLVVLITPLMDLGIIDISGIGSSLSGPSYSYSSVSGNTTHYWPIGSNDTTINNGVTFAAGVPAVTTITSNYSVKEEFRNDVHNGIDIGNDGNGPGVINVIAAKDGTVIYPSSTSQTSYDDNGYYGNPDGDGFGNFVMISHNDGTTTVYAHLAKDSITVFNGDKVSQGQVISKMGNSGSSTGTHLHFEVRVNGNRVDPNGFVSVNNARPKSGTTY